MSQQNSVNKRELEEALSEIVLGIWNNMLGVEAGVDNIASLDQTIPTLSSSVHIIGDWHGSVVLHCTEQAATLFAERLFSGADILVGEKELEDVLRELVNMVGGNLKPLLGERCVLTTPKVVRGTGFTTNLPETDELIRTAFHDERHCFAISLHMDNQDLNTQIREANLE